MAPERFTVRLDDERAAWVDEQAEQRDRSRAWVIRQAVDAARGDESAFGAVRTGAEGTGAVRTAEVVAKIDTLAERLEGVEAAIQEGGSVKTDESFKSPRQQAESGALRAGEDDTMEHLAGDDSTAGVSGGEREEAASAGADDEVRAFVERVAEREGWDDDGRREARIDAAAAALQAVRERGQLGKSEAVDDLGLFDEFPVAGQDAETWWRRNVRPVLREVADYSRGVHGYVLDDSGERTDLSSNLTKSGGGVYDPTKEF